MFGYVENNNQHAEFSFFSLSIKYVLPVVDKNFFGVMFYAARHKFCRIFVLCPENIVSHFKFLIFFCENNKYVDEIKIQNIKIRTNL